MTKTLIVLILSTFSFFSYTFADTGNADRRWLNEQTTFKKFVNLNSPRVYAQRYPSTTLKGRVQDFFISLVEKIYQFSPNKKLAGQDITNFFNRCSQIEKFKILRDVCRVISEEYVGPLFIQSPFTLSGIVNLLSQEQSGVHRGAEYSNLDEIFPLLNHLYMAIHSEYALGELLFGFSTDGIEENDGTFKNTLNSIVILKAGDTHRQEFAKISSDYNKELSKALTLVNGELNLLILIESSLGEGKGYKFKLEPTGEWKNIGCFSLKNTEQPRSRYYDSYKNIETHLLEELRLSECDPAIKIITII